MQPFRQFPRHTRRNPWWLRNWRAWLLLVVFAGLLVAIVQLLTPAPVPQGVQVEISTNAAGVHHLNGQPIMIGDLESRLKTLRATGKPVFAAILVEPRAANQTGWPSPEIEALLARLEISWMSGVSRDRSGSAPSDGGGGDHGR